jgi:hypothetical protein
MKRFSSIVQEMQVATDRSQYKSLGSAVRSIYDRKVGELKPEKMSDEELAQAQNRKIQVQRKIIDNA